MSEEPKVAEKKPEPHVCHPNNFHEAAFRQNSWFAIADVGVKPDDILNIEYWRHHAAQKIRPGDKIAVMCEDKSWYVEAVVFATYGHGAVVRFISQPVIIREKAELPAAESDYVVEDLGLAKRWGIRRTKDSRIVQSGLESREAANKWVYEYLRAQGQRAA